MKTCFKRMTALLLMAVLLCGLLPVTATAANNDGLRSIVRSYTAGSGTFTLRESSRIFVVGNSAPTGNLLSTLKVAASAFASTGYPSTTPMTIVYGQESNICEGDIVVKKGNLESDEAYQVTVTSNRVEITYGNVTRESFYGNDYSYNGLLYGFYFLMKSCKTNASATIPCCTVSDAPDTKARIISLDCARKYWSMEWIRNMIREASWMGYNSIQLHMTEDQGFRSNIWRDKNGNTVLDCNGNDFNWAVGGNVVSWNTGYPENDRFYNRDELIEIVNLAKEYHIEIIPSVDFPNHADALIARFKSSFVDTGIDHTFNFNGQSFTGHTNIGLTNTQTLNVVDDYARNLALALLDAYADFFGKLGCDKFGVGADEVTGVPDSWATASYTVNHGGSNYKDAFVIFENELVALLKQPKYGNDNHSYTCRAYNDCLFGTNFYSQTGTDTTQATVPVDPELEVCYWTAGKDYTDKASIVASNRTVYNCISFYTYYVLRNSDASGGGDARDKTNSYWSFNHSTADWIYSGCGRSCYYGSACDGLGWNPSRFVGSGSDYHKETVTQNLGGGYFLIWGDWAGWNTESQVWYGTDSSRKYNLIDRMWSNSVKMWNWDVDSGLSYSAFANFCNSIHEYPGFTSCTSAPASVGNIKVEYCVNLNELSQLVNNPKRSNWYTPESYGPYLEALTNASQILGDHNATQSQVDNAVAQLKAAISQLVRVPGSALVVLKTRLDGREVEFDQIFVGEVQGNTFTVELPNYLGYRLSSVENGVYIPSASGSVSGALIGQINDVDTTVTVWYDNSPYLSLLEMVLRSPVENDNYVNYEDYQTALADAQTFYNSVSKSPKTLTYQQEVDTYLQNVMRTIVALAKGGSDVELKANLATNTVNAGKTAVIEAETTANVKDLTLTLGGSEVTRLSISSKFEGAEKKLWRVLVQVPENTGTYQYTLTAVGVEGNATGTLSVTVQ